MKKLIIIATLFCMSQLMYSQWNTESKEYNEIIKRYEKEGTNPYSENSQDYLILKDAVDATIDIVVEDIILSVNESIVKSELILSGRWKPIEAPTCPLLNILVVDNSIYEFPRIVISDYGYSGCENSVGDIKFGKVVSIMSNPRDSVGTRITNTFFGFFRNGIGYDGIVIMNTERIDDRVGKTATIHYNVEYNLTAVIMNKFKVKYSGEKYKLVRKARY